MNHNVTELLAAAASGDDSARDRLFDTLYEELRRCAHRQLRGANQTLSTTALVHETYVKLAAADTLELRSRQHFMALAARAMRQTVIDHARARLAEKRGGDLLRTELDDGVPDLHADAEQALALDQALAVLESQDQALAEVFTLRTFAGLSAQQIADLHGVTERTVQRNLSLARGYLRLALDGAS